VTSDILGFVYVGAEVKVGESVKVDPTEFEACIHLSQVRVLRGCYVLVYVFACVDKISDLLLCRLLLVRQRRRNQMSLWLST